MKPIKRPLILAIAVVEISAFGILSHAQANEECSNASLKGSFGVTSTGTITGVGPFASIGRFSADGQGNHSGAETVDFNGTISELSFTGTYQVNSDCTGTDTENFVGGPTVHRSFVIDDNGKEVRFVVTNPGTVVTVIARKQFPRHGPPTR